MKFVIASDIHGSAYWCEKLMALVEQEKPGIWAAWGTIIEKRPYLRQCLLDMLEIGNTYGANWYCAGKVSKKGHPHHPLYLRKDEKIRPFDTTNYLRSL